MSKNIFLSWSGGKDSALALYEIQKANSHNVAALLTTITEDYDRISMHGVRRALLEQQAEALELPVKKILIPKDSTNAIYEARMRALLEEGLREGIDTVAFGDIFLEDLKLYREKNLAQLGMKGLFPIWKRDSAELARTFIGLGFKAVLVCVDAAILDPSFAGRPYDRNCSAIFHPTSIPAARTENSIPLPLTAPSLNTRSITPWVRWCGGITIAFAICARLTLMPRISE